MRKTVLIAGALAAAVAGCGQKAEQAATLNAAQNQSSAEARHPTFCFFKDEETKGWAAKRAANGEITVTGKAHVKDSRYQASLGSPEVDGASAKLWLSINPNSSAYGATNDWWDVTATLPGSAAVTDVSVMCGPKVLAKLSVPAR